MDKLKECPCRYCTQDTGRCVGCHATCTKYIEWRKLKDSYNRVREESNKFLPRHIRFNY